MALQENHPLLIYQSPLRHHFVFFRGYTPLALSFGPVIRTSIRSTINTDTNNTGWWVGGELMPAHFVIRSQVPFSIIFTQFLSVKGHLPLKISFCHLKGAQLVIRSQWHVSIIFTQFLLVKYQLPLKLSFCHSRGNTPFK